MFNFRTTLQSDLQLLFGVKAAKNNTTKHTDHTACILKTSLLVHLGMWPLSPVTVPLEVEPQLEDPISKLTTEAMSV